MKNKYYKDAGQYICHYYKAISEERAILVTDLDQHSYIMNVHIDNIRANGEPVESTKEEFEHYFNKVNNLLIQLIND